MSVKTDMLVGILIIIFTATLCFMVSISNKIDKIYSILDPEKVETQIQVLESK
jgi:hypothetical protein